MSRGSEQHSAGGLVVHKGQVLLIRPAQDRWQLPKGHIELGETPAETAVREVREETGIQARVRSELGTIQYSFTTRKNRRVHKRVDYFLMAYVSGTTADFDPGEVEAALWLPASDAIDRLTFENEREVAHRGLATTLEGPRA